MLTLKASREPATAIAAHAEAAIQLLDQARDGAPEVAFLPTYYALLNLAKIYIIVAGRLADLQQQRWHGATHSGALKASQDLMTDTVTLKGKGAIPLLYTVLTGLKVPHGNLTLKMSEVYRHIWNVGYEYQRLYGPLQAFEQVHIDFENDPAGGQRLFAYLPVTDRPLALKKDLRLLANFKSDPARPNTFVTTTVGGDESKARLILLSRVRRSLLVTDGDQWDGVYTWTPVSNRHFLWPEEVPILLAFFHMSNVVRYNPEFLARLKDSRSWGLLLILRNHAALTFLHRFWENLLKSCFNIQR
jgi:predicted heme/steroid binding protein